MKKTIRLLLILLSSVFLLAGCASAEYIALTDEESDAIAQYCAYLMLKYDKNEVEKRKLLEVKELQDIYKEEKA